MILRTILLINFLFFIISCTNKSDVYQPTEIQNPYSLYKEGLEAFEKNDFFNAEKKFSEAELGFGEIELAAKSAIMSSFSLYAMNFYDRSVENLNRYLKTYPADSNVIYAHYLISIIYFEQISDEKKDLKPLLEAQDKINFFLKKYPETDYALDLKFKRDLIQNQLAAKELFIAKYYISVQKWAAAIKRLQNIITTYEKTIFVEEALHRLVEVYYNMGLEDEAKEFAKILGYNYNSSKWFEQSYKLLNKDYKIKSLKKDENKDNFLKRIIKKIS